MLVTTTTMRRLLFLGGVWGRRRRRRRLDVATLRVPQPSRHPSLRAARRHHHFLRRLGFSFLHVTFLLGGRCLDSRSVFTPSCRFVLRAALGRRHVATRTALGETIVLDRSFDPHCMASLQWCIFLTILLASRSWERLQFAGHLVARSLQLINHNPLEPLLDLLRPLKFYESFLALTLWIIHQLRKDSLADGNITLDVAPASGTACSSDNSVGSRRRHILILVACDGCCPRDWGNWLVITVVRCLALCNRLQSPFAARLWRKIMSRSLRGRTQIQR
mmetsp:Transcript_52209/g.114604  ORF Transcript_52209/g.114604 Transcript_52209/m.114604 type:complete len:276 (-) Transcript_52209:1221-2048(-)